MNFTCIMNVRYLGEETLVWFSHGSNRGRLLNYWRTFPPSSKQIFVMQKCVPKNTSKEVPESKNLYPLLKSDQY